MKVLLGSGKMGKKSIFVLVVLALSINNISLIFASDISSLIKDLKDKDSAKDASYELAKIGKPAVPELIKALESNNKYSKRYAARTLREIGQDASGAIPALSKLLKDWDAQTRGYAVEALGKMLQQAEQVKPLLEKASKDWDKNVREKAKRAIKNLTLTRAQIEQIVKNRMNSGGTKNKCTSVSLESESSNKYTGFVKFENGVRSRIIVTVTEQGVQYSFEKTIPKTITPPKNGYTNRARTRYQSPKKSTNTSNLKTVRPKDYLHWWNSPIKIGRLEVKPVTIAIIIFIITLIIIIGIAVKKTNDGVVIFFSSYFDLFLSFLPFIILVISLIVIASQSEEENSEIPTWVIPTAIIVAVLYNYVKAYFDNRHAKFLAFCVGTGRITLGYLLPIVIILSLLELFSPREERESRGEWITKKITSGLILGGAAVFLHSLIGSSRRSFEIDEEYNQCWYKNEYYGNDGNNESPHSKYESTFIRTKTPREVLNVSQNATHEEIKEAYRKMAHQYHPDKTAQLGPELQELAKKKMQQINESYELLMKNQTSNDKPQPPEASNTTLKPYQAEALEIFIAWGERRNEAMELIQLTCKKYPDVNLAEELIPLVYRLKQGI